MSLITISGKVSDMFWLTVHDSELEHEGYVPESSLGGGDYIDFTIDNETGTIVGWKPLDLEELKE